MYTIERATVMCSGKRKKWFDDLRNHTGDNAIQEILQLYDDFACIMYNTADEAIQQMLDFYNDISALHRPLPTMICDYDYALITLPASDEERKEFKVKCWEWELSRNNLEIRGGDLYSIQKQKGVI